jgi:hypothetical protein
MNKAELLAKIEAMRAKKIAEEIKLQEPIAEETMQTEAEVEAEVKIEVTNLTETPTILKQLLGIVDTIEESQDTSEVALKKASEQVEKTKAYIVYLQSILPILEAKTQAMIEAKHKPNPIIIQSKVNYNLN